MQLSYNLLDVDKFFRCFYEKVSNVIDLQLQKISAG